MKYILLLPLLLLLSCDGPPKRAYRVKYYNTLRNIHYTAITDLRTGYKTGDTIDASDGLSDEIWRAVILDTLK